MCPSAGESLWAGHSGILLFLEGVGGQAVNFHGHNKTGGQAEGKARGKKGARFGVLVPQTSRFPGSLYQNGSLALSTSSKNTV